MPYIYNIFFIYIKYFKFYKIKKFGLYMHSICIKLRGSEIECGQKGSDPV